MQQCQAALAKQQPFTLHLLPARASSASHTRRLIIAHFKSAATEHLNSAAPLVGVPGQVEWKSGEAGHLYFVTIQKDEPDDRSTSCPVVFTLHLGIVIMCKLHIGLMTMTLATVAGKPSGDRSLAR